MLDLTPFGFTPTESQAYASLLELGPSSGYAVARALSIARANAYQALDGLVAKGAAVRIDESPRRYRAVQPKSVFASLLAAEGRKLDRLEEQLAAQPAEGTAPVIQLSGERAIVDAAVRAIVRSDGPVTVVVRSGLLGALGPALRARSAAGRSLEVWTDAGTDHQGPFPVRDLPDGAFAQVFPSAGLLLLADGALIATGDEPAVGFWSEAAIVRETVAAAIRSLTEDVNHSVG